MGGILTKSISIISDALHDLGDALSIGIYYFLEKISKKKPNNKYTFGYLRYSIIGAIITNTILILGSILVIISSINRLYNPVELNYNGMIIFAIVGFIMNLVAAYKTKDGHSLNEKAVNLHMLEDVLGWLIVLIGSFIIKFTKIYSIDSIMSICVSLFIMYHAIKSYKEVLNLFLEKTSDNISIDELKNELLNIKDIIDVHHIHVWSIDCIENFATMHIVTKLNNHKKLKSEVKELLKEYNIDHTTIEIENELDDCHELECNINQTNHSHHHHH